MPEIAEIVGSDDEYQDAVSADDSVTNSTSTSAATYATTTTEVKTDPLASSEPTNAELKTESFTSETHLPTKMSDLNIDDENAETDSDTKPEYICEDINEEELAEKEKSMTAEELEANKVKANQMKLEANELFKNDKAGESVDIYTEALKICPLTATKERAVLYGNRAAAKIKLESKKSAIDDCSKALELWPDYVRALLRRAKLYEHDDKLDEALTDYKRVYELDPGQHEAREALVRLPPIIEERNERLKEEMLDKLKELGNMVLKPFGLSTSNFQMQKDPNTGSYSINFKNS